MPTFPDQQSKPSQPKSTIRGFKFPEVRQAQNSNSGQRTTAESSQGLTPNPDQMKSGSEAPAGSNQSNASQLTNNQPTTELLKRPQPWISFGPVHGDDDRDRDVNQNAKQSAWEHMEKSDKGVEYLRSIANVRDDVKKSYDENVVDWVDRDPEIFMEMMAKDGCYFLQLALHILGAGDLLCYPPNDPFFGEHSNPSSYIPAMYYVGNQIPYVAINALMKQAFFKKIIAHKETWKRLRKEAREDPVKLALYQVVVEPQLVVDPRPPSDILRIIEDTRKRRPDEDQAKLALYQAVVERHLEKRKKKPNKIFLPRKQPSPKDPPSDILEALRNLHLGWHNDPSNSDMKEFHDLEAATDGKDIPIPGAGDLYKKGIKLVKGKTGITNIRFKNMGYAAFLYVPPFTVDKHTEHLLTSLANRELDLNESERELTSYLRFMRDLARTYKDFRILEKKRIICIKEDKLKGTMVQMLDAIVSRHNSNYTLNFRQIRRKINDYGGPPWRFISFSLGVFTVVQTIFTVLSYFFPPRT